MVIWWANRAGFLLWVLFVATRGEVQAKAAEDKKTAAGNTLHFQRDASHTVTGFTLDAGRTKGLLFGRSSPGMKPGVN